MKEIEKYDLKLKKCISCASSDISDYKKDYTGVNISRCMKCGLQFMNPQYTEEYLDNYYATYTTDDEFEYWNKALVYGHSFYLSKIEKYISPGYLLDIGCGNGYLLEAAIKRGWEVVGYDVDENSTKKVSDRLGVKVYHGDFLEQFNDCEQKYDVVSMHQVLEHLKNPKRYLDSIYKLLKDDGYIFIAVPNISSMSNRLKSFAEKVGLRTKNVGKYYDTSHHVAYYTPNTLVHLLENTGYNVLYKRNGHKTRPNQSRLKRWMMRNFTESIFPQSTFFVIAKKK